MSRVFPRRAVLHFVIGLASFLSAIAFTGCTPVPVSDTQSHGTEPDDSAVVDTAGTDDDPSFPPMSGPADNPTDSSTGDSNSADNNPPEPVDDAVPPPDMSEPAPGDDADADLTPAENPPDAVVADEPNSPPPAEDPPPTNNNPPAGGTGGNPDPPVDNPPANDPPANDPPAQDPPAEDPPSNDPQSNWPNNAYCAMSANWDANWAAFEAEVVVLVNQRRAAGANCGSAGSFPPANPLSMNPSLQCAARNHSMDMNVRNFFSHTNPDGQGPGYRISLAGYTFSWWGENIAWGYSTPTAVVNGWMNSPGHCANIMNANFTEIGVGYYSGHYWTQTFGRP